MAKKIGHFNVVIEPLSKARLHSIADGYPAEEIISFVDYGRLSVLILILSIVNYINLATANAKLNEVGVRKLWVLQKYYCYSIYF
jgi:putative ABC transport system permease protein